MNRTRIAAAAAAVAAAWTGTILTAQTTPAGVTTRTPIKHVVVLFQENRPFDHYFGTYPRAENRSGETPFYAKGNTPSVNGYTYDLLHNNPNLVQPFRVS